MVTYRKIKLLMMILAAFYLCDVYFIPGVISDSVADFILIYLILILILIPLLQLKIT